MVVRWAVIADPFLGNSLVNTFLWQQLTHATGEWGVVYVVCAEKL
jgi:hypothetical protein